MNAEGAVDNAPKRMLVAEVGRNESELSGIGGRSRSEDMDVVRVVVDRE